MRVALPVEDKSMESSICQSFGRAPYFLIYDTESKKGDFQDNKAAASQGGAGLKAAQTIVDSRVEALLTPRCGENAASVINTAHIKIYKTVNESILDNIEAFTGGKLELLDEIHAGFHKHGRR